MGYYPSARVQSLKLVIKTLIYKLLLVMSYSAALRLGLNVQKILILGWNYFLLPPLGKAGTRLPSQNILIIRYSVLDLYYVGLIRGGSGTD